MISAVNKKPEICLTVAGLDPSGGAGIIADVKTFTAFGCFAAAAIASLTFQNTRGVFGAAHQTAEIVRRQIEPVIDDYEITAVKAGMLPTREIIETVAEIVRKYELKNFVADPVVRSTSGYNLIDDDALQSLIEQLFPLSTLVTPNVPEAERLARMPIKNTGDIKNAARKIQSFGAANVLIKGGHLPISDAEFRIADLGETETISIAADYSEEKTTNSAARFAKDFLFTGEKITVFESKYIENGSIHGTGCVLSAAIAANLALGKSLIEAVTTAKKFVTEGIYHAPQIGKGMPPVGIGRR